MEELLNDLIRFYIFVATIWFFQEWKETKKVVDSFIIGLFWVYEIFYRISKNRKMEYEKIALFGPKKSRGTFDDFYSLKYKSLQDAYAANDYVECNFVRDEKGILYIEARNVKNPDERKYHKLEIQRCFLGLDVLDDNMASKMAETLL